MNAEMIWNVAIFDLIMNTFAFKVVIEQTIIKNKKQIYYVSKIYVPILLTGAATIIIRNLFIVFTLMVVFLL